MRKTEKMFYQTYQLDSEVNIKYRNYHDYRKRASNNPRLEQDIMMIKNYMHLY